MADVVVQMGHVPRKSGATGTHREQEFTRAVGPLLRWTLAERGHHVHLIGADDPVPASDVFIALHTDGSTNPARRGASVGYPDDAGGQLASAWKRAHQRHGYPAGFLRDNYTEGLRQYYGFGRSTARWRFLAEHGTTTNTDDAQWLFNHLEQVVAAHVDAVGEVVGHPATPPQEDTVYVYRDGPHLVAFSLIGRRRLESMEEVDYWRASLRLPVEEVDLSTDPRLREAVLRLPWTEPWQ